MVSPTAQLKDVEEVEDAEVKTVAKDVVAKEEEAVEVDIKAALQFLNSL